MSNSSKKRAKERKKQIRNLQNLRAEERKKQIRNLQNLRAEAIELEKKIAEQRLENFKQFNIRNLKIFGNTCNFLAPFVVSATLTVGSFSFFGGGLPFHTDEITKYKTYSLEYQTNGDITMEEFYRTDRWYERSSPSNELLVYTPWEYKDNQYIRYKREYDISKLSTLDLFNAVLEKDYAYITENIKEYREEIQVVNTIEETEGQDYFFEASLDMLDKEDTLKYNETDRKNIIITIIELVLGLGIGSLVALDRDFNYLQELNNVNRNYHYRIKAIKPMQANLKAINKKILTLSRKSGGKNNE